MPDLRFNFEFEGETIHGQYSAEKNWLEVCYQTEKAQDPDGAFYGAIGAGIVGLLVGGVIAVVMQAGMWVVIGVLGGAMFGACEPTWTDSQSQAKLNRALKVGFKVLAEKQAEAREADARRQAEAQRQERERAERERRQAAERAEEKRQAAEVARLAELEQQFSVSFRRFALEQMERGAIEVYGEAALDQAARQFPAVLGRYEFAQARDAGLLDRSQHPDVVREKIRGAALGKIVGQLEPPTRAR